jgi:hypothetical protein
MPYLNNKQATEQFVLHAFQNTKQVEKGLEKRVEEMV